MGKTHIGKRLRGARVGMGLSQEQLAQDLGVSPMAVRDWEIGAKRPTRANAAKVEMWLRDGSRFDASPKVYEDDTELDRGQFKVYVLRLRVRHRMSQDQLAEELGVTTTTVCKWERGHCVPTFYNYEMVKEWDRLKSLEMDDRRLPSALDRKRKGPVAVKEKDDSMEEAFEIPDEVFENIGNEVAPWKLPPEHPKRRAYEVMINDKRRERGIDGPKGKDKAKSRKG